MGFDPNLYIDRFLLIQYFITLPVQSHEHKGVYGYECRADNQELVQLAPSVPKGPGRGEGIVRGGEGDTHHYK